MIQNIKINPFIEIIDSSRLNDAIDISEDIKEIEPKFNKETERDNEKETKQFKYYRKK